MTAYPDICGIQLEADFFLLRNYYKNCFGVRRSYTGGRDCAPFTGQHMG